MNNTRTTPRTVAAGIVDTHTGEVVADHGAVAPGDSSVMDEHYFILVVVNMRWCFPRRPDRRLHSDAPTSQPRPQFTTRGRASWFAIRALVSQSGIADRSPIGFGTKTVG